MQLDIIPGPAAPNLISDYRKQERDRLGKDPFKSKNENKNAELGIREIPQFLTPNL